MLGKMHESVQTIVCFSDILCLEFARSTLLSYQTLSTHRALITDPWILGSGVENLTFGCYAGICCSTCNVDEISSIMPITSIIVELTNIQSQMSLHIDTADWSLDVMVSMYG